MEHVSKLTAVPCSDAYEIVHILTVMHRPAADTLDIER
jgi:hypothetical protein